MRKEIIIMELRRNQESKGYRLRVPAETVESTKKLLANISVGLPTLIAEYARQTPPTHLYTLYRLWLPKRRQADELQSYQVRIGHDTLSYIESVLTFEDAKPDHRHVLIMAEAVVMDLVERNLKHG